MRTKQEVLVYIEERDDIIAGKDKTIKMCGTEIEKLKSYLIVSADLGKKYETRHAMDVKHHIETRRWLEQMAGHVSLRLRRQRVAGNERAAYVWCLKCLKTILRADMGVGSPRIGAMRGEKPEVRFRCESGLNEKGELERRKD